MIGHVRDVLSTYRSDAITPIVLQPDMVYANLWALRHSYSFRSVNSYWNSHWHQVDKVIDLVLTFVRLKLAFCITCAVRILVLA